MNCFWVDHRIGAKYRTIKVNWLKQNQHQQFMNDIVCVKASLGIYPKYRQKYFLIRSRTFSRLNLDRHWPSQTMLLDIESLTPQPAQNTTRWQTTPFRFSKRQLLWCQIYFRKICSSDYILAASLWIVFVFLKMEKKGAEKTLFNKI